MAPSQSDEDEGIPNRTVKKFEIEAALRAENEDIKAGNLKDDNPLEISEDFRQLCEAARRGDLKVCQEKIQEGASLCGHFEVVQLLLEAGALCERDTFQGERALYNALNDKIRNLLLSYDYSKSRDPLQPLAGHVTSVLHRDIPDTSDITLSTDEKDFHLHKFLLSARSPYFAKKLVAAPETTSWKVPTSIPTKSLKIAIEALYFAEINLELNGSEGDQAIIAGIEKLGRLLEIEGLVDIIFETDRRRARQRRTDEVEKGRNQIDLWFQTNVLGKQMHVDSDKAKDVKWDRRNSIFADVLLCVTDDEDQNETLSSAATNPIPTNSGTQVKGGIPIGPSTSDVDKTSTKTASRQTTLIPAHKAMLIRSEYFLAMFSSPFQEAQTTEHLPVIEVDCSPPVLRLILTYLYTERCNMSLALAIPTLFAADMLFIDRLKVQAGTVISTLGNGSASVVEAENPRGEIKDVVQGGESQEVDIYDVLRAGWDTRVHRLEEFAARYIAYRLERFIDEEEFKQLVRESAARIKGRQETDTVELIDDIRYYLSERYRLRFEETGFEDMIEGGDQQQGALEAAQVNGADAGKDVPPGEANHEGKDVQDHYAPELGGGAVRTLDGELAGDEFAQDAINYQILLGKIDTLLENLDLDA